MLRILDEIVFEYTTFYFIIFFNYIIIRKQMVLQSSGQISFADIQTEFGGTNPIEIAEYYTNNASGFTNNVSGLPTTGNSISLQSFYGKTKPVLGFTGFTFHTFTNAGATGRAGPILSQLRSAYSYASWAQNDSYLSMTTQGIQLWTVPATGSYTITAVGALGGSGRNTGGYGTSMKGTFNLTEGEIIKIMVGQKGGNRSSTGGTNETEGGGGGGTFVAKSDNTPMIVAGGGGGSGSASNGLNASTSTSGVAGGSSGSGDGGINGGGGGGAAGGAAGNGSTPGGTGSYCSYGAGGGGFYSRGGYNCDGTVGSQGSSFLEGGIGGAGGEGRGDAEGGFGGGASVGHRSAGGGGYSGGGGDVGVSGGGGGDRIITGQIKQIL